MEIRGTKNHVYWSDVEIEMKQFPASYAEMLAKAGKDARRQMRYYARKHAKPGETDDE